MNEYDRAHKPFDEVIVAKIVEDLSRRGHFVLQPIRRWVLIRRDSESGSSGAIELPESQRYRSQRATVIACGSDCSLVSPGSRVVYQGRALLIDFEFGERYGMEGDPKDYAMIQEGDLHAVLRLE